MVVYTWLSCLRYTTLEHQLAFSAATPNDFTAVETGPSSRKSLLQRRSALAHHVPCLNPLRHLITLTAEKRPDV